MLDYVAKKLMNIFEDLSLYFFLGGSRRFGYETPNSDYDIFVFGSTDVIRKLFELGFRRVEVNNEYQFSVHFRLRVGESHIDVIVIEDKESFFALQREHEYVNAIVDKFDCHSLMFVKKIKKLTGASGADIYRVLKNC